MLATRPDIIAITRTFDGIEAAARRKMWQYRSISL